MEYIVATSQERPDLEPARHKMVIDAWPTFMGMDPILNQHWHYLTDIYSAYQFYLLKPGTDEILALANCMPLPTEAVSTPLSIRGIDWMFDLLDETSRKSFENKELFAIQIVVNLAMLGSGLSTEAIKVMAEIGRKHGCRNLYAPVRPNHKPRYPLMAMEAYVNWRREDGLLFDPWMRVHERLGAEVVNVCSESMTIPGSIEQWEEWTNLKFPVSGDYIIEGGLVPLKIEIEKNVGWYIEPNVWMRHRL